MRVVHTEELSHAAAKVSGQRRGCPPKSCHIVSGETVAKLGRPENRWITYKAGHKLTKVNHDLHGKTIHEDLVVNKRREALLLICE